MYDSTPKKICAETGCQAKMPMDLKEGYCAFGHYNRSTGWGRPMCECGFDKLLEIGEKPIFHAFYCPCFNWAKG